MGATQFPTFAFLVPSSEPLTQVVTYNCKFCRSTAWGCSGEDIYSQWFSSGSRGGSRPSCFAPLAYSLEPVTWPSPVTTSLEAWQFGPCSVMQFESVEVQPVLSPKLCLPIDLGLGYSHLAWGWVRLPQTGGSGGGLATPKRPNNFILFYFYFFRVGPWRWFPNPPIWGGGAHP